MGSEMKPFLTEAGILHVTACYKLTVMTGFSLINNR